MLHQYFPAARIDVQAMNDHVVLSGTVANASESSKVKDLAARYIGAADGAGAAGSAADNVLNMLSIEGKEQVMLKVTVAEMQRNIIKQLGVDLSSAAALGNFALGDRKSTRLNS